MWDGFFTRTVSLMWYAVVLFGRFRLYRFARRGCTAVAHIILEVVYTIRCSSSLTKRETSVFLIAGDKKTFCRSLKHHLIRSASVFASFCANSVHHNRIELILRCLLVHGYTCYRDLICLYRPFSRLFGCRDFAATTLSSFSLRYSAILHVAGRNAGPWSFRSNGGLPYYLTD